MSILVLIAGPSGSGKTTLAKRLIAGDCPDLHPIGLGAENYDLKLMPHDLPPVCIVECGTQNWARMIRLPQWRRILELMPSYDRVVAVNVRISRWQLTRMYGRRIFTNPKRLNPLLRVLRIGRWVQAYRYLCTGCANEAFAAWERYDWPARAERVTMAITPGAR